LGFWGGEGKCSTPALRGGTGNRLGNAVTQFPRDGKCKTISGIVSQINEERRDVSVLSRVG